MICPAEMLVGKRTIKVKGQYKMEGLKRVIMKMR